MDVQPSWLAPPCRVYVSLLLSRFIVLEMYDAFKPGYASLELIALAKQKKREETSKLKILRIKKREYRDGIKSKETRPGWGEAQCIQSM